MNKSLAPWLWQASIFIALLPFWILCYYTQPFHDDYANGVRVQEMGIWGAQAHLYAHWTGRFFTSLLLTAGNPLSYGWVGGVAWIMILLFGLKLLIVMLLLRTLTVDKLPWLLAGWMAAIILLLYASMVPSTYSAFYYFTDGVVYQVPALLLILSPVATVRAQCSASTTNRLIWWGVAILATVAAAGSNELTIVLLSWILLVAISLSIYHKQWLALRYWLVISCTMLVAATVAIAAPGNYYRVEIDSDPFPGIVPLVIRTADVLQDLVFAPNALLILSIPLIFAPWAIRFLPARPTSLKLPLTGGAAIVMGGIWLGTMLYQSVWNEPMPLRANCVLFWWWLISWIVACWAAAPAKPVASQFPSLTIRMVTIVVLALVVCRVSLRAWREVVTAAPQYAAQWQERYQYFQAINRQPGRRAVVAPLIGISSHGVLLNGLDYKTDSKHPYNAQTAKWFGLAEVVRSDAQ